MNPATPRENGVPTLRRRLVVALGSLATGAIALSLALLVSNQRIAGAFADVRRDEAASHDALMLGVAVREQYMHEAHTLIERGRSHLAHHHTWVEQVALAARDLEPRVPAAERWRVRRIAETSREIDRHFQGTIVRALEQHDSEEVTREHRVIDRLVSQASSDADSLAIALERRMRDAHERVERATASARWIAAIGAAALIVLAAWHALRLREHAVRPLARLVDATRAIARGEVPDRSRGGDLEVRAVEDALVRLAGELRERQARLVASERMAVLGQLAAGVAHEVNNPIGIIRGYLRTMIPEVKDEEQRRELLILDEEAAACQRIAADLLAFARSDELRTTDVEIAGLVRETIDRLESSGATGDVSLSADVQPEVLRIDGGRIRQVLENLVRNAAQVSGAEGAAVEVIGRREDGGYRLEVADRGPGVAAADRDRVFEPFFSKRPGGSGLGLAVCLGVVRAHGGMIAVSDREGGGAVFEIVLPAALAPEASPRPKLDDEASEG